jgi:hypothetical protein
MKKPRWQEPNGGGCQWPRCRDEGSVHYSRGATKWIDPEDGVDLCDKHQAQMSEELFPAPVMPHEVGSQVWLAEMEDWPREQVWVRDWAVSGVGNIVVYVSDEPDTPLDDCQEIDLEMIEDETA